MRRSGRHSKPNDDSAVGTGAGSSSKALPREFRVKTCLRGGSILDVFQQKLSDCLFLNLSMHGACLRLPTELPLPPKLIVFDERLAISINANVRWQRGKEVGVYIPDGVPAWAPRLCDEDGRTRIAWGRPDRGAEPADDRR